MSDTPRILYCHCAYAHVVPHKTKEAVLRALSDSGAAFDAVPDLCEMAARRDPSLKSLVTANGNGDGGVSDAGEGTSSGTSGGTTGGTSGGGGCQIVACYPRAVKWLLHGAGVTMPDDAQVLNMRTEEPEAIISKLLGEAMAAERAAPNRRDGTQDQEVLQKSDS